MREWVVDDSARQHLASTAQLSFYPSSSPLITSDEVASHVSQILESESSKKKKKKKKKTYLSDPLTLTQSSCWCSV